ncbi:hypothetical protein CEY12_12350 [Chryseobacterium sp. T16E-39]|uniref:DUF6759 domain-containing protein n=1 Tax=Chryseobacterium sp. T16E-39 TaxID=2015076 RepID=UPI000B5B1783|nr:DUF6759 domain-containing protein [Chryseobacterium sp. T16E-39]ASK30854.1 hypothetical protein CEY12_12350 [Chryseobacterium sp. T16E-39]
MKKKILTLLFFSFLIPNFIPAQKSKQNILKSTNIKEIEEYLKNAHPEDPKRSVLKPKLIALKNQQWTLGRKNAKPMESRPVIAEIPRKNSHDAEEFKRLILESSQKHKDKTVKLLNALFDEDPTRKESILLFKNNSECNLVLRIQGDNFYHMAVPAHDENFIVVKKGTYSLESTICDLKYNTKKDIRKNIILTINNTEQVGTNNFKNKK